MPLFNASIANQMATQIFRKSFNLNTFIIGNNTLLTASGSLELTGLLIQITTAPTSAGAPTLSIGPLSIQTRYLNAQALVGFGTGIISGNPPQSGVNASSPIGVAANAMAGPIQLYTGAIINALQAAAVFTGGVMQITAIYTPFDVGASLS